MQRMLPPGEYDRRATSPFAKLLWPSLVYFYSDLHARQKKWSGGRARAMTADNGLSSCYTDIYLHANTNKLLA